MQARAHLDDCDPIERRRKLLVAIKLEEKLDVPTVVLEATPGGPAERLLVGAGDQSGDPPRALRQRMVEHTRKAELASWQLRQLVPRIER